MLRGINLGPKRRVPMSALRELLDAQGFGEVRTYLQSGNVVLSSELEGAELEHRCSTLLAERFGFEVPAIVRTREELAEVVRRNPLADAATEPKRYQVSFLSDPLAKDQLATLQSLASPDEQLVAVGRELYAWHPGGVARSKLWNALAGSTLGVTATARNWTTVTALSDMAQD